MSQSQSVLVFRLSGSIADIDESTSDEAPNVTTVLVVEVGDTFCRVLVPEIVLQDRRALLCAGRPVEIVGVVQLLARTRVRVATELKLAGRAH